MLPILDLPIRAVWDHIAEASQAGHMLLSDVGLRAAARRAGKRLGLREGASVIGVVSGLMGTAYGRGGEKSRLK